mmetsp:Transcript_7916/g.15759  ORF Transcript_7916/g.15759 Transcript_7916/m.15759 type:complete len:291 (-) Transcript_7916:301-1173(-)
MDDAVLPRLLVLVVVARLVKVANAVGSVLREAQEMGLPRHLLRDGQSPVLLEAGLEAPAVDKLQHAPEHHVVPAHTHKLHHVGVPKLLHQEALEAEALDGFFVNRDQLLHRHGLVLVSSERNGSEGALAEHAIYLHILARDEDLAKLVAPLLALLLHGLLHDLDLLVAVLLLPEALVKVPHLYLHGLPLSVERSHFDRHNFLYVVHLPIRVITEGDDQDDEDCDASYNPASIILLGGNFEDFGATGQVLTPIEEGDLQSDIIALRELFPSSVHVAVSLFCGVDGTGRLPG